MSLLALSPVEAQRRVESGAALVDIREADEYAREHIPGAHHHALSGMGKTPLGGEREVIFLCRSGNRTTANAARLRAAAPGRAASLEGGIDAWKKAGLPVIHDKRQPLELMRQVQIAAGSLVLMGICLGATISPIFYGLSGFVGAGLVFTGTTGTCGMARVLAVAPWNRRSAAAI
jgi:rhodanese-related sulfurtransferase